MSGRSFFIEGVWEHLGRTFKKGSKKGPLCKPDVFYVGDLFSVMWIQKMSVFWDPLLSAENRPQAPPKVHSGASGSQKAPKMDPQSDAFGCLWKVDFCGYLQCFLHF